ncbi:DUF1311 domain-containing protein [Paracoccus sp. S-4012]|uniref:lysozyme inhibitor LprI family protein n=1 Tax=Paracoccus sp. S-4012 TaxID=2665648 RepID=UPI0012AFF361|nr:lysozyme inhibitor LprI family protein [Paracoccus sp. S-4012]MRX50323.1 DUF1311 domain-containing protein [Paracoccus sp. S-4012]
MAVVRMALLAAALAGPAAAQDAPAPDGYDPRVLDACHAARDGEARADCIGIAASLCLEGALNGTAVAVAACYAAEGAQWQARLDEALAALRASAAATDDAAPEGPRRADALETAQSSWAAWREAECAWFAQGFHGEASAAAEAECAMEATARRALSLDAARMAEQGP